LNKGFESKLSILYMVLSRVRMSYPLQWGSPTFDAGDVFGVMTAAFAALVESTGGFYAVSRLAGATPPPPYVLSRGIGWQGIGVLLDGFFGTFTGATVAPENVGLIGLTRVGSRRVIQISAVFMIFFSIFGKFGGILAAIPQPIVAAILCITFGMVGEYLSITMTNFVFHRIVILRSSVHFSPRKDGNN
jgi:xanthine/uracil permease